MSCAGRRKEHDPSRITDERCRHHRVTSMTHNLLDVCTPTPSRRGSRDGSRRPSRHSGDLASPVREIDASCGVFSRALVSSPTSRAAAAPARARLGSLDALRAGAAAPCSPASTGSASVHGESFHRHAIEQRRFCSCFAEENDFSSSPWAAVMRSSALAPFVSRPSFQISCSHRTLPNTPKRRVTAYMRWRTGSFLFRESSVSVMRLRGRAIALRWSSIFLCRSRLVAVS